VRTYYQAPIPPLHIADGSAFNTFTTFQSIAPAPGVVLPANILETGSEIELSFDAAFSCNTGVTLGLGFLLGSTVLAAGTAIATGTTPASWPCHAEWKGRVRAVGAGTNASVQGSGWWMIGTSLTAFSTVQVMPATLALRTVGFDSTAAQAIAPGAVWGTSAAANTITVNRFSCTLIS
jgi:hypothetical protein